MLARIILILLPAALCSCGEKGKNSRHNKDAIVKNGEIKSKEKAFFDDKILPLLEAKPCSTCHTKDTKICSHDILNYETAQALLMSPEDSEADTNDFYVNMNTDKEHEDFACTDETQSEICKRVQEWWNLEPKVDRAPEKLACKDIKPTPSPSPAPSPSPSPVPDVTGKKYFTDYLAPLLEKKGQPGCSETGEGSSGCHGPRPKGLRPRDDRSKELTYGVAKKYLLKAVKPDKSSTRERNVLLNAAQNGKNQEDQLMSKHPITCSSLMTSPCREISIWFDKEKKKK